MAPRESNGNETILLESNGLPIGEPNRLAHLALMGSLEAANALVDYFRPRLVFMIAKRLRGTTIDPEDVVQESLTKAFQQIHTFNPQYQFSTWLFTIAIRSATDARRKYQRHPANIQYELDGFAAKPPAHESEDTTQRIWQLAQSVLVESQFEVLWLRFGEEMTIADIAKVLRKTQVGVRVLLHRARTKLQSAMEKNNTLVPSEGTSISKPTDGIPAERWEN
jgi:RNA polymerase sigma-70 factor (ECF subfamily)